MRAKNRENMSKTPWLMRPAPPELEIAQNRQRADRSPPGLTVKFSRVRVLLSSAWKKTINALATRPPTRPYGKGNHLPPEPFCAVGTRSLVSTVSLPPAAGIRAN